jgi:hypothetical protein
MKFATIAGTLYGKDTGTVQFINQLGQDFKYPIQILMGKSVEL